MLDQLSVDDLKQQLQDKEKTVATLTQYLEQAAEKLNALKKQKSAGKPARAFDSEMVHRQMELVGQLQAAVEEWEELQVPDVMSRLGTQLENLRQTILDGLASSAPSQEPSFSELGVSLPLREAEGEEGDSVGDWEALKAEMLGEETSQAENEEEQLNIDLQAELDVLVNRPPHVESDQADRRVWEDAVDSREKYMISLIRALRVVENRRRGTPDWESFTEAPDALREEVAQLAAKLQQTQRNAEVELSIERARISRQESVIAQQRRELDKARKKQGVNPQTPANPVADSQQGRWQRFLGRGDSGE